MALTGKTFVFKTPLAQGYAAENKAWREDLNDLFTCDGVLYTELSVRSKSGKINYSNVSDTVTVYDGSVWADNKYKQITFVNEVDELNSEGTQAELESWLGDNATYVIPKTGQKYVMFESQIQAIADAIRAKTGKSGTIAFPDGFVEEIGELK